MSATNSQNNSQTNWTSPTYETDFPTQPSYVISRSISYSIVGTAEYGKDFIFDPSSDTQSLSGTFTGAQSDFHIVLDLTHTRATTIGLAYHIDMATQFSGGSIQNQSYDAVPYIVNVVANHSQSPTSADISISSNDGSDPSVIEGGDPAKFVFSLPQAASSDIEVDASFADAAAADQLQLLNGGKYIIPAGTTYIEIPVVSATSDQITEKTQQTAINFSAHPLLSTDPVNITGGSSQNILIYDQATQPISSNNKPAIDWSDAVLSTRDALFNVIENASSAEDIASGLKVLSGISGSVGVIITAVSGKDLLNRADGRLKSAHTQSELYEANKNNFIDYIDYAAKNVYNIGASAAAIGLVSAFGLTGAILALPVAAVGTALYYYEIEDKVKSSAANYYDEHYNSSSVPPQSANDGPSTHNGSTGDGGAQVASVGTIVHDVKSAGGEVFALYDALLNRPPDMAGLQSWTAALNSGLNLHDVTTAMLASPEVQSHLNAVNNGDFVSQVYELVLHREGDLAGLQRWTTALDNGTLSRADFVNEAVFSSEHVASIQPDLDAGVFVPDQNAVAIAQLYYTTLGRGPDADGLQAYTTALESGATSLHDIARAALGSSEYASHTGTVSDNAYVESIYEQVLGRQGDVAGLQFWTDALAQGTARADVASAAVESSEFQGQYAGQGNAAYVEGLYEHLLGRQGDASGLQSWTNALDSHTTTRVDLANAFVNSAEFQAHFGLQNGGANGGPSDAAFVDNLYENALGRHADSAGLQGWTDALAHGTSRADVAVAIAEGTEAQQHLAAQIQQSYHVA